ncbi:unnamed protein product [Phyllotreta striolata]|uniref:Malate dehydrogenase n=1 Tax=Phyllotreta striolata TaxID=444603 RepID=A0A9N9TQF7_PHYSR|nr:unnamed protein product [Phyllotreta striolata]
MIPSGLLCLFRRNFSVSLKNNYKVAVLGASGGLGQPLALLLKLNRMIKQLDLYDLVKAPGVAVDCSHIETPPKCKGYGKKDLKKALKGAHIVMIAAGLGRKPGMTRDDLFKKNADLIKEIMEKCAKVCPKALVGIITNPVNSLVPIACEILKQNCGDPKRVFGITTLDTCRANTFVGEYAKKSPLDINVPVIGGHSADTMIPLFSQTTPKVDLCGEVVQKMTKRVQNAGTEVVKAKGSSSTLSIAYAAARFTNSLLRGLKGEKNVIESAYVKSDVVCGVSYFATPLLLGKNGIEKNLGVGKLNKFEKKIMAKAVKALKKNIDKGVKFAKSSKC